MTEVTNELLAKIAAKADSLPEQYRVIAFQELLRAEIAKKLPSVNVSAPSNDRPRKPAADVDKARPSPDSPSWFQDVLEAAPEPHDVSELGRDAEVGWAVIQLFDRGETANTETIRNIIKDELGSSPESKSNLSSRLGKLHPKYLHRNKDGRRYVYFPTKNTSKIF